MKNRKSFLVLAAIFLFVYWIQTDDCEKAINSQQASEIATIKKAVAPENLQTASFEIEGMTCAVGCARTIEKELVAMEGIQEATVDFDTKTATVSFDKNLQNPETLTKAVQASADGKTYKVSNLKS
ncbi:heavy-metal-associated domain-containing protein [Flavobacterium sp. TAB 87]|uniref:heavy-metal-associated domain-containing protein n=1 Tax=Flavobacterium sp. TAB 87 TaxID=1729581 RepID=UPI00076DC8EE|nr:heavy metal-associated domain-containing protein [Flavobacterium sp. TAB 87]KVV13852.1 Periplasmic mercury ion-binding protein [Flavobacterium sp. TAB 87]